ncbi:MAG: 50S ribosomal protein L29 [Candidatus Yonathbacteria bacterium RIFCSPHIGHO2_01_FULL_51_10]|uniref:Large ribosomal subunit protein uL29 n=1 Tax=Candidatus Yonathbacteria bacterium RIFCSPHIGHO2_01_FULL_51_10 TaxID=1802723 RepID=A0A1G2S9Z2_9BACT|nr:MAG: 50S ribosomal protein L29 [Candidatus Yonathbacteria bacterium RIFCSPHIGHO2_01_FULL_51_10]
MNTKDTNNLHTELAESRKALFSFRTAVTGAKVKNVKEGRTIRKNIARILTELSLRRANTQVSE